MSDSIVEEICALHKARAEKGRIKYGTTLDRKDLVVDDWLQHLLEELMDAAVYVLKVKKELLENKVVLNTDVHGDLIDPRYVTLWGDVSRDQARDLVVFLIQSGINAHLSQRHGEVEAIEVLKTDMPKLNDMELDMSDWEPDVADLD